LQTIQMVIAIASNPIGTKTQMRTIIRTLFSAELLGAGLTSMAGPPNRIAWYVWLSYLMSNGACFASYIRA